MEMAIAVSTYTLSIATIWGKEHTLEPTLIQGFYALVQTTAAQPLGIAHQGLCLTKHKINTTL